MLLNRAILLCLLVCLVCSGAEAAGDSIIVRRDPRVDWLIQQQAAANRYSAQFTSTGLLKGYRIQVISTSRRDEAFRIKSELLSRFPGEKSYVLYQSPNFKTRIGNFISKEDAEKMKAVLNKIYPRGVYIVEDGIEYTPRNTADSTQQ